MSFRTKLFWIFLITVLASVSVVAYGVSYYTRAAFEEMDKERTEALVAQFKKEFAQQGELVAQQVRNIAGAEITLRMAIDLSKPNADQSLYIRDARGAAEDHGLDFLEIYSANGTLISSYQYQARVGYKSDFVISDVDWNSTAPFLRREELPEGVAVSLSAVRTPPEAPRMLYLIGGRRLDKNLLASLVLPHGMRALLYSNIDQEFQPAALTDANGPLEQAERFQPIIQQIRKNPEATVQTINWSSDPSGAETFHALPLEGRNKELLGVLLVGSSRSELVSLTRRIVLIAAVVAAGALLIGLIVSFWVAARITKPVEELAEGAREVASGRWETRIDARGRDEIGQLASAFNGMTQTLASQRDRLVQTERVAAWRELARRLAHEVRNPLFPLQITVENLQRARQLPPDQFQEVFAESTSTLKAELTNLNTIVSRFSDFSKMPTPEFTRVNVNESLRNVMRLFEPQFNAVGKPVITPEYFLTEPLPEIDADPDLLHKAFQNLVLNALDAMPAGGALMLRTAEHDGHLRIEVRDTGKGLTPEECSRLFTPYYTTKQQGTGLGLAIVQSVVSDHHGTISVASDEGRGTTFRIDLPLRQAGRPAAPAAQASATPQAEATPAAATD